MLLVVGASSWSRGALTGAGVKVERPEPGARTNDLDVGEDQRRLREGDGS